jgi:heptaprenyl diphosphate synthase
LDDIQNDLLLVEKELNRHVQAPHEVLTQTSKHLLKAGGKRLRPAFALLAGKFADYSLQNLLPLAVALEMIHMASLVHDDVVDRALTRRGIPTVKAKWGNTLSLQTGDYLLAKSLTLIAGYTETRIAKILAKASTEMCQGEIQQIASTFDIRQNIRDYFYRIKRKTAMLISASCQLGAVASGAPAVVERALQKYGHYLGMAFQITDDILDVIADEKELGKPVGSDLKQGILTLPTIFALKVSSRKERLEKLLLSRFAEKNSINEALEIIKNCEAVDMSFQIATKYLGKAKKQLSYLPDTPYKATLNLLADFVGTRRF